MPNQYTKNPTPTSQRFWAKVDKNGPVPEYAPHLDNCWLWIGWRRKGYGRFLDSRKHVSAHRWAYTQEHGAIPDGLECDHLCRVRHCVRPSHIELVTRLENVRRGMGNGSEAHCPAGHPYDEANTRIYRGSRKCRLCSRDRHRRLRA